MCKSRSSRMNWTAGHSFMLVVFRDSRSLDENEELVEKIRCFALRCVA